VSHGSKDTIHALKAELATMQRVVAEKNRDFDNLTSLLKQLKTANEQSASDYDDLSGQHDKLKKEVQSSKTAESRLNALEESAARDRKGLENELKAARNSAKRLTEENQDLAVAVEQLREMLTKEEEENNRKGNDAQRELRIVRARVEKLEADLLTSRNENQELSARMDALSTLGQGNPDPLVDDLIRCKLDLANAWEQIDHYKQRVKQLSPDQHISPNSSGNKPSSNSFERRGTRR
jgi:chromosome segregation ATPase